MARVDWIDVKDATEFIDTQDVEFVEVTGAAAGAGWNEFVLEDASEVLVTEYGEALVTEEIPPAVPAVDYIAYATLGVYSDAYGSDELNYLCNLYASWGLLEDAPNVTTNISEKMIYYLQQMEVISG